MNQLVNKDEPRHSVKSGFMVARSDSPVVYLLRISGFIFGVFFLLSSFACTNHVAVTVPLFPARLDPPELSYSSHKVSLGVSLKHPNDIVIIPDATVNPPILNHPRLSNSRPQPYFAPFLGVTGFKRFELSYDIYGGIMLRTQLLGKTNEESTRGDQSATCAVGYNYSEDSEDRNTSYYYRIGYLRPEYNWHLKTIHSNLVYGYRIHKDVLFFGGASYELFSLSGDLYQHEYHNVDNSSSIREYSINYSGFRQGIGLGIEYTYDAIVAEQSLAYTLQLSKLSMGASSIEPVLNHSIILKYSF